MQVPEEFKHVAQCFYQGSAQEVSSEKEWIALALRNSRRKHHVVVKQFLAELLARNPSGADLRRIWAEAGPDYMFPDDEHLRSILILMRDMIE